MSKELCERLHRMALPDPYDERDTPNAKLMREAKSTIEQQDARIKRLEATIEQAWEAIGGRESHWIEHTDQDGHPRRDQLTLSGALIFLSEKAAERDRLEAESERLREDAERYRWLRDNMTFHDINPYATGTGILTPVYRKWFHDSNALHANTLDAAIDAARKEGK